VRIAEPWFLLLVLLVPVLVVVSQRRTLRASIGFSEAGSVRDLPRSLASRLRSALPWLRALALASFVVALARPQWGVEATRIYTKGIAIVMVVDISSSMAALDLQIDDARANRLDVIKATFRDFVTGDGDELPGRENDLIGMVTFARYADEVSPLTLDHKALLALLEGVDIVALPEEDGTAIGDAIVMGVDTVREAGDANQVMILLTDGSNNAGDADPRDAARAAAALGVKIYAIGAGSQGTALMPVRQAEGGVKLMPSQVYIDEYTLNDVAAITGGRYFRATDAEALRAIYAEIDRLEKTTNVAENYQRYIEGFTLFLALGLGLLLLEVLLVNTRLRTVP